MELEFQKSILSCLMPAVQEVQNSEQTQEIKLPDGMPDIGRVICAWGQAILRGKEWRSDNVAFTGGMMVWVLYAPEDGTAERCIDGWIPFQMKWDLPDNSPEGTIRISCLPRFVDARSVSPRKIMVRAGMAAMAEAMVPMEAEVLSPENVPEDVQLLRNRYPIRFAVEAGEKAFVVDEDLTLPGSAPIPEKLIYYNLHPKVTDQKVIANKIVFRGTGELHILYRCEEGQLCSWTFSIPFSQYGELRTDHSPDAQSDMVVSPTSLELDLDDEGHLRFKGGLVGQYRITDKKMVELVQDAYSPERELQVDMDQLQLPAILESRRENIYGEQTIPADANVAVDVSFLPDFPRQRKGENGVEMEYPGTFQVLYYGEDGLLRSGTARFDGQQMIAAGDGSQVTVMPMNTEEPQGISGNGNILIKGELPLEMITTTTQGIPMVTGLELGQKRQPDPARPSLILRRAGNGGLWDIAKSTNSTLEAIRQANNLQNEPTSGQILLIPVS